VKRITALLSIAAMLSVSAYAGAKDALRTQPLPQEPASGGFDWYDASVGGVFVLGAVLLVAGLVALSRRGGRRRHATLVCLGVALLLTLTASAFAAGPEYKNFTTLPFSETETSCTGETVEVSGVIRHHVVFVNDAAGGFHGNGIFTVIAKGTSSSGTRYVTNFTDLLIQYIAAGDAPAAATGPFSFRLISNDGTPNLYVQGAFHITVDAHGEIIVDLSDLSLDCR
jgi:hypothetical protein